MRRQMTGRMRNGSAAAATPGATRRWLTAIGLVALAWLAPGIGQRAWAQTVTTCAPAASKGADGPVDYGAYCWIDFGGLNLTSAKSVGGQAFRVNLRGGAYLTFTLKITPGNTAGNNMYAVPVPSWSGAAFGNSAFNSIPGSPILYQDTNNQNAPQDTVTLSSLTLHANGASELPFVFVAADGESSNAGETLSFSTTGANWSLVSAPGQSNPARNMPTLSPPTSVGNSTGVQTVNIAGTDAGADGEGSYVFTTDNSPGTVTATMLGNGLQGVLFGVKYHTIGLSLTKTHEGEFKAGGTGVYTIKVANTVTYPQINPPTEPQPIRVVDTLPTGLTFASASGSGWSCSAVGQVVTCDTTSLQDLTTSKAFPPITLNVNVATNAPSTLVNSAAVSDPTLTTLVFNVCETTNNGVCPNNAVTGTSGTNQDGDSTIILHSNLSTSTKTVMDVNGGDARPGDVLEYTITINETSGIAATNVSVLDNIAAQLGSLTVTSKPAGSTDTSTASQLNIGGINIPASGTAIIVYRVTISGSAANGATVDNTATITNPDTNGAGKIAVAPTVTVVNPPAGGGGNKILYLRDNTGAPAAVLTRLQQETTTTAYPINRNSNFTFNLSPTIATGKQLALPAQYVQVNLVMAATGNSTGNARSVTATLYNGGTAIGSTNFSVANGNAFYQGQIQLTAPQTIAANSGLNLRITNNTTNTNRNITVSQYVPAVGRSTISFYTSTVIKVDSVLTYANAACTGSPITPSYNPGSPVYICAKVSDPFGYADINPAAGGTIPSIVIANAGGVALASDAMTDLGGSAATKTFRYTYTVPATTSYGAWSAKVTAWEGAEGTVLDTGTGNFTVAAPPPNLSTSTKTWTDTNGGDAQKGDVLEYTITLKETAGTAANNVSVVDDMAALLGSSLVVISKPSGSIDTSTGNKLQIGGINIPANGTATIVYQVTISTSATNGATIDNIANITNPGGSNYNAEAPPVTVTVPAPVTNGNKYLYLRNEAPIATKLKRAQPVGDGTVVSIASATNAEWTLDPAIPVGQTLALPTSMTGRIVVATTGSNLTTARTITLSVWTATCAACTFTQRGTGTISVSGATATVYPFTITGIPAGTSLAAGGVLKLRVANGGSAGRGIDVSQRNGFDWETNYSFLTFDTTTVIKIDAAAVYSQPSPGIGGKAAYIENDSVYVRATVSDPFGTDDISSVTVVVTNPSGVTVATGTMTPLPDADTTDGSRSYEFIFTVPGNAPRGGWTAKVTAKEGVENKVADVRNVGFVVQGGVWLGKTWGSGATPGDTVNLTISGALATTAGTSTSGGSTTQATAASAAGTTLTLAEAFTSGSAGAYTITLTCTRTKDGIALAASGTALSRTIVMPSDSGVTCVWSNAKSVPLTVVKLVTIVSDPVNGSTNPKAIPGAVAEYQIIVTNPAASPVDINTVFITDQVPANMDLRVADIGASGSGPVQYVNGSPDSGMTYTYTGLGNATDDIAFSSDGGATWGYTPVIDANGTDPAVTNVRINPKGVFNANNAQFTIKIRMRVE